MTSPATNSAWPVATRYHGRRCRGSCIFAPITMAIDAESPMTLKSGPTRIGCTKTNAVSKAPPIDR